jgi:hypothetical protein
MLDSKGELSCYWVLFDIITLVCGVIGSIIAFFGEAVLYRRRWSKVDSKVCAKV